MQAGEGQNGRERKGKRILSRLRAKCRGRGASSHNPETVTPAKTKSLKVNQLSHPGAPVMRELISLIIKQTKRIRKIVSDWQRLLKILLILVIGETDTTKICI